MKAKNLGRNELLGWVNFITISEYYKIENLSDAIGFCQVIEVFFPGCFNPINTEDKEKNFIILNVAFQKIEVLKTVDPYTLSKSKFKENFELLQFIYDLILKKFPETYANPANNALEQRLEALKFQYPKFSMDNINKYLPNHLLATDIIKYDRNKNSDENKLIAKKDNKKAIKNNSLLDKYKEFLIILKDDLKKSIENNMILSSDIVEIEEEKNYYLEKLVKLNNFIKENSKQQNSEIENNIQNKHFEEILKIILQIPEDFK